MHLCIRAASLRIEYCLRRIWRAQAGRDLELLAKPSLRTCLRSGRMQRIDAHQGGAGGRAQNLVNLGPRPTTPARPTFGMSAFNSEGES